MKVLFVIDVVEKIVEENLEENDNDTALNYVFQKAFKGFD